MRMKEDEANQEKDSKQEGEENGKRMEVGHEGWGEGCTFSSC